MLGRFLDGEATARCGVLLFGLPARVRLADQSFGAFTGRCLRLPVVQNLPPVSIAEIVGNTDGVAPVGAIDTHANMPSTALFALAVAECYSAINCDEARVSQACLNNVTCSKERSFDRLTQESRNNRATNMFACSIARCEKTQRPPMPRF